MTDKLQFWDKQAKEHGASDLATAPDHYYRELEIEKIRRMIAQVKPKTVLDVGCGNGYSTFELAEEFPDAKFVGIDFSEEMIGIAQKQAVAEGVVNVVFEKGDVLSLSRVPLIANHQFDMVISCRCLINLDNWSEQKLGILEMRKMLSDDGYLLLVENMKQGLENLNDIRKSLDLEPIKERWHNFYIPDGDFAKFLKETEGHLFHLEYSENIGNMYYLASRVIYAALAKEEGKEPEYGHPINKIASQLPTLGQEYACSPNHMFLLRNITKGTKWVGNPTLS